MRRVAFAVVAVACAFMVFGCSQKRPKAAKAAPGLQRIHFDLDRSNIKPEYQPVMQGNAAWLQKNKKANLTIEGNCDSRGSVEYNIALGDRRAQAAKAYLISLGTPANKLSTISYGKERPLCTQQTESCWWQNRRDDFVAR